MADDDQQQTTDTQTDENRIPRSRLNAEIEKRKAAEKRLNDLEARFAELEDKDKPEIERLSRDLERAQKKAEDAEKHAEQVRVEAQQAQRKNVVTEAAAKLGFRNPADAALFVDLEQIEDSSAAEKALKNVAKERDYLLAPKTPDPSGLDRVLTGDQNRTPDNKDGLIPVEEAERVWGQQMYEGLMGAKPASPAA